MNSRFSATFTALATTTMTSGVRMFDTPRRKPCPASAINANGSPSEPTRRYSTASSPVWPWPPIRLTSGTASAERTMVRQSPMPVASQSAWAASPPAPALSPAPDRRATWAVVP